MLKCAMLGTFTVNTFKNLSPTVDVSAVYFENSFIAYFAVKATQNEKISNKVQSVEPCSTKLSLLLIQLLLCSYLCLFWFGKRVCFFSYFS